LISEFKTDDPTFAILKHNNACGLATRKTISDAYNVALACDPNIWWCIDCKQKIDIATAIEINKLFYEVVILLNTMQKIEILQQKKNRIILIQNEVDSPQNKLDLV
jgi:phosphoribosylaminoimidazolecarboxamide formyltransferase/IMP cyclohydrolase